MRLLRLTLCACAQLFLVGSSLAPKASFYKVASSASSPSPSSVVTIQNHPSGTITVIQVNKPIPNFSFDQLKDHLPGLPTLDGKITKIRRIDVSYQQRVANVWHEQEGKDPQLVRAIFSIDDHGVMYFQFVTHCLWLYPLDTSSSVSCSQNFSQNFISTP